MSQVQFGYPARGGDKTAVISAPGASIGTDICRLQIDDTTALSKLDLLKAVDVIRQRIVETTWPLEGGSGSTGRMSLDGADILDTDGTVMQLRGINFGRYGADQTGDGALFAGMGANIVRFVAPRWWGVYGAPGIDARNDSAPLTAYIDLGHLTTMDAVIAEIKAAGLKLILAFDSNCGQSGLQDGGFGGTASLYCDPSQIYPLGRNFFTDSSQKLLFKAAWRFIAARYLGQIDIYELLPEPLAGAGAEYAVNVRNFYAELIDDLTSIDQNALFLVGPRDAYNINHTAEAYMSGRQNVIYTGNMLNPVITDIADFTSRVVNLTDMRSDSSVPLLVQQMGRQSVNDPSLYFMHAGMAWANANRMHYTWWLSRDPATADEYALYYADGLGGYTEKTAEIAAFTYHMTETFAAVEAAAIAAATAAGAHLWYVKADLSNVKQLSGGTVAVTAVNDPVGYFDPVVGATTRFTQATAAARPLLTTTVNGYALQFDGVDDYLDAAVQLYVSGDDTTVIVAGTVSDTAASRVACHAGASAANPRHPYLAVDAGDNPSASWRGDDTVLRQITSTYVAPDIPLVLTASKIGADKKLFLNGAQEGATDTGAVGSIASIARTRVGSSASGGSFWGGPIAMICLGKTMSDAQRQAVERFGAYLTGTFYQA